ncbi:MAG TPA: glycosyltransferase family 2 protein [Casimicrobiaceae bacterium]|nr:glycosyltransferase family 2 protein [Casimicrobiaceae bacterium]
MIGERVSIVVLTFNRRDELLRTLSQLARIDGSVRIVVVDNASTDDTVQAVAQRHPRVDILRLPRNVGAAGRNAGALACTTRYVAFCDDDTWWLPESIACAADALDRHPTLAAVTARVLVGEMGREDPTNARMASSPLPNTLGVRGTELLGVLGGACMMRRDAFLAVGGYDPRLFLGGEEALLATDLMSAGWRMAYVPEAVVCHYPSGTRDVVVRRRLARRNALWFAWLRRPWRRVLKATRDWWTQSRGDATPWRDAIAALSGLPWIIRARRRVPSPVERALATIEAFYADGDSRRAPRVAASPAETR